MINQEATRRRHGREPSSVEEQLRLTNERFAAALDASPVVVFNQDQNLRYTWIHNPALGYRADQLVGMSDEEMFERADDAQRVIAIKRSVLESGAPQRQVVPVFDRGVDRWYDLHVQPQRDAAGAIVGILCTAVDITERMQVADEEQQRIGRDLHDETGQELTALLLLADTLVDEAQAGKPLDPEVAARLRDGIRRSMNQVRDFSRGLLPVGLDAAGLQTALAALAAGISRSHHIECEFECPAPAIVADNRNATHLFRIAQQAVANAIRHGRPRRILISVTQGPDTLRLRVADDGVGIGGVALNGAGMGLRIMRHRANLIGAQLTVAPGRDGGTEVVCTLAGVATHVPAA
jgi:PAS domain S-box-containing protein